MRETREYSIFRALNDESLSAIPLVPRCSPSDEDWPNFRWTDPSDDRDVRDELEAEGVEFDTAGRADLAQRLTAEDLASLAGLETEELAGPEPGVEDGDEDDDELAAFDRLLAANHPDDVVDAVYVLLTAWQDLGGVLGLGEGKDASCFMLTPRIEGRPKLPWPFTVYSSSGVIEVVFQHLANRPPFDDIDLRRQFMDRLNSVEGIDLPASRIAKRPNFPISVLASEKQLDEVIEHLSWFIDVVNACGKESTGRK